MIKLLDEFSLPKEFPWLTCLLVVSLIFGSQFAVAIAIKSKFYLDIIFPLWMTFNLTFTPYALFKMYEKMVKRAKAYEGYLSGLPLETLKAASTSSEVDAMSKTVITGYLNKHHPGWSFDR